MSNATTSVRTAATSVWTYLLAAALVAVAVIAGQSATAGDGDQYTFLIRGDVMGVNTGEKTLKVYARHTSSAGENDLGGHIIEYKVKDAKFYDYNDKLQKKRTTIGHFEVGDEVVMRGAKKSAGHYNASWVVKNYHTVDLRGTLQGHNLQHAFMEVDIDMLVRKGDRKAYRTTTFPKGTRVTVYYDKDSTKFKSREGNDMNPDEVANNNEKISIENMEVKYGSRFEADAAATITDNKYTFTK